MHSWIESLTVGNLENNVLVFGFDALLDASLFADDLPKGWTRQDKTDVERSLIDGRRRRQLDHILKNIVVSSLSNCTDFWAESDNISLLEDMPLVWLHLERKIGTAFHLCPL